MNALKTIDLNSVSNYYSSSVINRFMSSYNVSLEEAEDIFSQTKLFLSLKAMHPNESIFIPSAFVVIDEMWHNFLLFTKEYASFCMDFYGKILHHQPCGVEVNNNIDIEASQLLLEAQKGRLKKLYSIIHDSLGKETLIKWTLIYSEKYTIEYLNAIRKPLS